MNHTSPHRSEETSMLAYYLWQQAHCPPGQDLHFWLKAEEQLFGKRNNGQSKSTGAAKSPNPSAAKAAAKRATASAGNGSVKSKSANVRKSARAH